MLVLLGVDHTVELQDLRLEHPQLGAEGGETRARDLVQMSNATETPLAQGLALERNLFLKLCITEPALARMRSYEEQKNHLAVALYRG